MEHIRKRKILCLMLSVLLLTTVWLLSIASAANEDAGDPMATATIAPLSGASIRVGNSAAESGIRFGFAVNKAWRESLGEDAVVGAVILPTDRLSELTLTHETDLSDFLNFEFNGQRHPESTEETDVYYASIVNLADQNFARAFTAIGYVKTAENTVFSAQSESRSVYEVAKNLRESGDWATASAKLKGRIDSYLDSVVALDGSLTPRPIFGYEAPYTVSYTNCELKISGVESVKSILIGDTVYTGGWYTDSVDGAIHAFYGTPTETAALSFDTLPAGWGGGANAAWRKGKASTCYDYATCMAPSPDGSAGGVLAMSTNRAADQSGQSFPISIADGSTAAAVKSFSYRVYIPKATEENTYDDYFTSTGGNILYQVVLGTSDKNLLYTELRTWCGEEGTGNKNMDATVSGFYLRLECGTAAASVAADLTDTILSLDTWHTVTFRLTLGEDPASFFYTVYLDGQYVTTSNIFWTNDGAESVSNPIGSPAITVKYVKRSKCNAYFDDFTYQEY